MWARLDAGSASLVRQSPVIARATCCTERGWLTTINVGEQGKGMDGKGKTPLKESNTPVLKVSIWSTQRPTACTQRHFMLHACN